MKLAIIGSRILSVNIADYIPNETTEIVSGGAKGIDELAEEYAIANGICFKKFLPQFEKYRRNAPLVRNKQIVDYADCVLAIWDGKSKGTKFTIDYAESLGKKVYIHIVSC